MTTLEMEITNFNGFVGPLRGSFYIEHDFSWKYFFPFFFSLKDRPIGKCQWKSWHQIASLRGLRALSLGARAWRRRRRLQAEGLPWRRRRQIGSRRLPLRQARAQRALAEGLLTFVTICVDDLMSIKSPLSKIGPAHGSPIHLSQNTGPVY